MPLTLVPQWAADRGTDRDQGPFVMNTWAEIDQAMDDYRKGRMGGNLTCSNDPREGCRASTSKLLLPPLRLFRHNS
jgi:hypothetical protein